MEKYAERAREGDLEFFTSMNEEALRKILKRTDEDGRTLFHSACLSNRLDLVEFLFQREPTLNVNNKDEEGWTALHSAASSGRTTIVEFLLNKTDADVNAFNSGKRTPLMYAASKGHVDVLRLLLAAGAKVDAVDGTGATALHRAAAVGMLGAVRILVEEARAALDPRDKNGETPLMLSVSGDQAKVAFYLSSKGADLEAENNEGQTPLFVSGENAPALRRAAAGESVATM
mmetsp:Transcript_21957/g.39144  ORF Transcript_21957/g.39144 Transcript_21957/m.39144 type:complete len:231 (-) Transcript_21957:251-943(-)|eukprot:CAMPEP_0175040384 /NCGR_PEP_ID=MMETSP0052_2-20121109/1231_1 /TAXON_ID=51329 ORGANISM="Polytomella parva, Strain SAG 63-3" /NCGR_SAMPLE_ID=MMETSP0052_2 /ASSEMBLY_ACC=CAM_ASM_000194 /LENGTH=230 /DNA_ID=CAMNT_0016302585 /DNA_START=109 /DNA_END=801 /DNA_ORIENTATION=+